MSIQMSPIKQHALLTQTAATIIISLIFHAPCLSIAASWTDTQAVKLIADDKTTDDEFGIAVALSGNTAVVGAHKGNGRVNGSGTSLRVRSRHGERGDVETSG